VKYNIFILNFTHYIIVNLYKINSKAYKCTNAYVQFKEVTDSSIELEFRDFNFSLQNCASLNFDFC